MDHESVTTFLKSVILSLLAGAVLGWFIGIGFYELVSVPQAEKMNPMGRESFLCTAGQAPLAFSLLGIILGMVFGSGLASGIVIRDKQMKN